MAMSLEAFDVLVAADPSRERIIEWVRKQLMDEDVKADEKRKRDAQRQRNKRDRVRVTPRDSDGLRVTPRDIASPAQTVEAAPPADPLNVEQTKKEEAADEEFPHTHTTLSYFLPFSKEEEEKKESKKESVMRARARGKRPIRLPDDWTLDVDDRAFAGTMLRADQIDHEFRKFCNHYWALAGPKSVSPNWHAKWRTWCMNAVNFNGGGNGQHRQGFTNGGGNGGGKTFSVLAVEAAERAAAYRQRS